MSKVYVTNKGGHDYSAARRWGPLVYMTEGQLSKYDTGQMFRECSEALANSEPDDWILLTSLTTLCSVACAIFAHRHGRLNLLIFRDDGYVERKIVFNGGNHKEVQVERKKRKGLFGIGNK